MRRLQRLNPGPGIVDFWTEFKRPNKYRWPILGGSALLTGSLMFLLTDHAVEFNWAVGAALAVIAAVVVVALVQEHVKPNWSVVAIAAMATAAIMYQFTKERVRIPPSPPTVTYITTFEPGRTDAEIAASNRANQVRQEKLRAEQAAREEQAKDAYRALGRATGLDVDAMERDIERERMAETANESSADGAIGQPGE
jgi:hypothetical protein